MQLLGSPTSRCCQQPPETANCGWAWMFLCAVSSLQTRAASHCDSRPSPFTSTTCYSHPPQKRCLRVQSRLRFLWPCPVGPPCSCVWPRCWVCWPQSPQVNRDSGCPWLGGLYPELGFSDRIFAAMVDDASDLVWQVGLRCLKSHHFKSQTHFWRCWPGCGSSTE